MGEKSAGNVECRECRSSIPADANLCVHCNAFQDWRRFFRLPNITLALLTALVSVLGIAAPAIYNVFHEPRSDAFLADLAVDGTRLRVTAINRGDAAAVLGSVQVSSEHLAPATKIRLRSDDAALLQPGMSLLSFDVIPLLDEGQSYADSLSAMTRMLVKSPEDSSVLFEVMQSDGIREIHELRLTNSDLFQILRSNADRCSAIEEPNFENGCIGPGSEARDRYEVSGPRLNETNEIVD